MAYFRKLFRVQVLVAERPLVSLVHTVRFFELLVDFEQELRQIFLLVSSLPTVNACELVFDAGQVERFLEAFLSFGPIVNLVVDMACFQVVADGSESEQSSSG